MFGNILDFTVFVLKLSFSIPLIYHEVLIYWLPIQQFPAEIISKTHWCHNSWGIHKLKKAAFPKIGLACKKAFSRKAYMKQAAMKNMQKAYCKKAYCKKAYCKKACCKKAYCKKAYCKKAYCKKLYSKKSIPQKKQTLKIILQKSILL